MRLSGRRDATAKNLLHLPADYLDMQKPTPELNKFTTSDRDAIKMKNLRLASKENDKENNFLEQQNFPQQKYLTTAEHTKNQQRPIKAAASQGAAAATATAESRHHHYHHPQQQKQIPQMLQQQQQSNAEMVDGVGGGSFCFDKTDIEQVLKSETARAPFQQFLQQQFCSENINFYLAVEEYRQIPDSEPERRADFGRLIFERHFAANCIEPVNIDNSTANSIREGYKQNKFTSDLYDVVQYQIFHLLKYDCWPRYLRAGGQFAEELGGGADSASTSGKHSGSTSDTSHHATTKQQRCGSNRRKSLFRFFRDRLNTHEEEFSNIAAQNFIIDSTSIDFSSNDISGQTSKKKGSLASSSSFSCLSVMGSSNPYTSGNWSRRVSRHSASEKIGFGAFSDNGFSSGDGGYANNDAVFSDFERNTEQGEKRSHASIPQSSTTTCLAKSAPLSYASDFVENLARTMQQPTNEELCNVSTTCTNLHSSYGDTESDKYFRVYRTCLGGTEFDSTGRQICRRPRSRKNSPLPSNGILHKPPIVTSLLPKNGMQTFSPKLNVFPPEAEDAQKNVSRRRSLAALSLGRRLGGGIARKIAAAGRESSRERQQKCCSVFLDGAISSASAQQLRRSASFSPRPKYNEDENVNNNFEENELFGETSHFAGQHYHHRHGVREPPADFPAKTCTLLSAECASSTEISLTDQLQSVKQWAAQMAESCGLDKNALEVVDAQTGATIDPARQAVDALNNRTVRLMAVVRFPVIFLAPSPLNAASPSKSPLPAKVVILRARSSLTVNKVLTPMMLKYNVDPTEAVICFSGTVEIVERQTPVGAFCPRPLTVMTHLQYAERKALTKRDYQKELNIVPLWLCSVSPSASGAPSTSAGGANNLGGASNASSSGGGDAAANAAAAALTFHQHGDVGFFEMPLEADSGKSLKHNATRSHSSNPKEFFKFGRKPSQAKSARGTGFGGGIAGAFTIGGIGDDHSGATHSAAGMTAAVGSPGGDSSAARQHGKMSSGSSFGLSDRRKSLGATAVCSSSGGGSGSMLIGGSNSASSSYKMSGSTRQQQNCGAPSSIARSMPQVEKSDIPYCGDEATTSAAPTPRVTRFAVDMDTVMPDPVSIASGFSTPPPSATMSSSIMAATSRTTTASQKSTHPSKSANSPALNASQNASGETPRYHHAYCYEIPDFLKTEPPASTTAANVQKGSNESGGTNGATSRLPAIYASTVRSDKETAVTPSDFIEGGLEWQKADYV